MVSSSESTAANSHTTSGKKSWRFWVAICLAVLFALAAGGTGLYFAFFAAPHKESVDDDDPNGGGGGGNTGDPNAKCACVASAGPTKDSRATTTCAVVRSECKRWKTLKTHGCNVAQLESAPDSETTVPYSMKDAATRQWSTWCPNRCKCDPKTGAQPLPGGPYACEAAERDCKRWKKPDSEGCSGSSTMEAAPAYTTSVPYAMKDDAARIWDNRCVRKWGCNAKLGVEFDRGGKHNYSEASANCKRWAVDCATKTARSVESDESVDWRWRPEAWSTPDGLFADACLWGCDSEKGPVTGAGLSDARDADAAYVASNCKRWKASCGQPEGKVELDPTNTLPYRMKSDAWSDLNTTCPSPPSGNVWECDLNHGVGNMWQVAGGAKRRMSRPQADEQCKPWNVSSCTPLEMGIVEPTALLTKPTQRVRKDAVVERAKNCRWKQ